jgi:hypothetical protein
MAGDCDKRTPIVPPAKGHPDDKLRTVAEAAAAAVPFGSSVAKLVGEFVPTQAQKARSEWEGDISARTNEHTNRLDQHEEAIAPRRESLTEVAAALAVALAREPGDGMRGRGRTLDHLCGLLPDIDRGQVEEAAFELQSHGLVDIQRALGKHWWLYLEQNFYEQIDHQVMDWESSTREDAKTLARLLLEDEARQRIATLHAATPWEKRRFNPALRVLLSLIPKGRMSGEIQADYPTTQVLLLSEDRARLKRFAADVR